MDNLILWTNYKPKKSNCLVFTFKKVLWNPNWNNCQILICLLWIIYFEDITKLTMLFHSFVAFVISNRVFKCVHLYKNNSKEFTTGVVNFLKTKGKSGLLFNKAICEQIVQTYISEIKEKLPQKVFCSFCVMHGFGNNWAWCGRSCLPCALYNNVSQCLL